MPLYTYIVTYRGASYVAQAKHSNFRGFVSSWTTDLPKDALPQPTPDLRDALFKKARHGEFAAVPNRTHVWKKTLELGGDDFVIHAVQTET
jgi:hypothetical protein